jgi:hypothetical protein
MGRLMSFRDEDEVNVEVFFSDVICEQYDEDSAKHIPKEYKPSIGRCDPRSLEESKTRTRKKHQKKITE